MFRSIKAEQEMLFRINQGSSQLDEKESHFNAKPKIRKSFEKLLKTLRQVSFLLWDYLP